MSIPQRTIDQLSNWIERFIGEQKKSVKYKEHLNKFVHPINQISTPIPCPNCFSKTEKFENCLKPIGKVFEVNVQGFKCQVCNFRFPELIGISMENFVDMVRTGRVQELLDQSIFEDLWIVEDGKYVVHLTDKQIRNYLASGKFNL